MESAAGFARSAIQLETVFSPERSHRGDVTQAETGGVAYGAKPHIRNLVGQAAHVIEEGPGQAAYQSDPQLLI